MSITTRSVKEMLRTAAKQPRETRQKWGCTSCDYIHPKDSMEWAVLVWQDGVTGMCNTCVSKYRSTANKKSKKSS